MMNNRLRRIGDIVFDPRILICFLTVHCILLSTVLGHQGWMYAVPFEIAGYTLCMTAYQLYWRRTTICRAELIPLSGLLLAELICLLLRGADHVATGALLCDTVLIAGVFICGGSIRKGSKQYASFFVLLVLLFDLCSSLSMIPGFPILSNYSLGIVDGDFTAISINCNQLATVNLCGLLFGVLFITDALRDKKWSKTILPAVCCVLFIVYILLTNSRTCEMIMAIFLMGCALLVPYFVTRDKRKMIAWQAFLCVLIVTVCAILSAVVFRGFNLIHEDDVKQKPFISKKYSTEETVKGKMNALFTNRLEIADIALELLSERPILGVGQGNLREPINRARGFAADHPSEYLHSGYLQVLCADGAIVFAFFIAALGIIIVKVARRFRLALSDPQEKESGRIAVCTLFLGCILLFNLAEGNFLTEFKHIGLLFWLITGVLLAPNPTAKPDD